MLGQTLRHLREPTWVLQPFPDGSSLSNAGMWRKAREASCGTGGGSVDRETVQIQMSQAERHSWEWAKISQSPHQRPMPCALIKMKRGKKRNSDFSRVLRHWSPHDVVSRPLRGQQITAEKCLDERSAPWCLSASGAYLLVALALCAIVGASNCCSHYCVHPEL